MLLFFFQNAQNIAIISVEQIKALDRPSRGEWTAWWCIMCFHIDMVQSYTDRIVAALSINQRQSRKLSSVIISADFPG